jgi:hypothetical protein
MCKSCETVRRTAAHLDQLFGDEPRVIDGQRQADVALGHQSGLHPQNKARGVRVIGTHAQRRKREWGRGREGYLENVGVGELLTQDRVADLA